MPHRIESSTTESLDVVVRPRQGQPPGFAHDGEVALDASAEAQASYAGSGYRTLIRIAPQALDVYRPSRASGSASGGSA